MLRVCKRCTLPGNVLTAPNVVRSAAPLVQPFAREDRRSAVAAGAHRLIVDDLRCLDAPASSRQVRGTPHGRQSVSFEWLLFIRDRVKRPKNPVGFLHCVSRGVVGVLPILITSMGTSRKLDTRR